jgi:hypothetical protein
MWGFISAKWFEQIGHSVLTVCGAGTASLRGLPERLFLLAPLPVACSGCIAAIWASMPAFSFLQCGHFLRRSLGPLPLLFLIFPPSGKPSALVVSLFIGRQMVDELKIELGIEFLFVVIMRG